MTPSATLLFQRSYRKMDFKNQICDNFGKTAKLCKASEDALMWEDG